MYSNRLALLKEPCSIFEASQIVAAKRSKKTKKSGPNTFALPEKPGCNGVVMGKWCINEAELGNQVACTCPRSAVAD